jgi:hypothetical protein
VIIYDIRTLFAGAVAVGGFASFASWRNGSARQGFSLDGHSSNVEKRYDVAATTSAAA